LLSLDYEPASEPLHISVKQLYHWGVEVSADSFSTKPACVSGQYLRVNSV